MKSEYQLRVFVSSEIEEALRWIKYKTGKSYAEVIRDAIDQHQPILKAIEEVRKQKENENK